jgi:hypothetical protein
MSATVSIKAMNGLSETQRRRVLQLQAEIQSMTSELETILHRTAAQPEVVELHDRNIGETQAEDLRARLKTFSKDWDRPENDIYDQSPAR